MPTSSRPQDVTQGCNRSSTIVVRHGVMPATRCTTVAESMISEQAILIIEPDTATRALYQRELSKRYRVFSLPDDHHALKLLLTEHIGAIIIEPALPGSSGWDFVTALKHRPRTRLIPVIICSVLDERPPGRQLDVACYLVKPVLPMTLLEVLRPLVEPG